MGILTEERKGLPLMYVTENDRKRRALVYMRAELEAEKALLESMEGYQIREIIIMRNKKVMYIAELEQLIRNMEDEIRENGKKAAAI